MTELSSQVEVNVKPYFIEQRSIKDKVHYVFGYHVTITNNSAQPIQLLRRRWLITDSDGIQSEVEGEGVVGLQPTIEPTQQFEYRSGSSFTTPLGFMQGEYTMLSQQQQFNVEIAPFRLADNSMIH